MISLGQLTDWIIEHRKGDAFPYCKEKIAGLLNRCIENESMLCVTDNDTILGVICYEVFEKCKTVHVHDVLCIKHEAFRKMMQYHMKHFPGFKLQGSRKDKVVEYNINKLAKLI